MFHTKSDKLKDLLDLIILHKEMFSLHTAYGHVDYTLFLKMLERATAQSIDTLIETETKHLNYNNDKVKEYTNSKDRSNKSLLSMYKDDINETTIYLNRLNEMKKSGFNYYHTIECGDNHGDFVGGVYAEIDYNRDTFNIQTNDLIVIPNCEH